MKQPLAHILKILLGLVFVVSAVLKIVDMDWFEIYVYSYHFFSLNFSFLVARAAIIVELVLGVGLVINCFHKQMWWGSVLMLLVYTGLLTYAWILGRTDNCHCFGDYLKFNPWQSIIKNVVLLILFALVYHVKSRKFGLGLLALFGTAVKVLVMMVVVAVSCIIVFAVSPPDNWTRSYYPTNELNQELFVGALQQPPLETINLVEGRKVVGIFSSGCEYCMLTAQKLSLMQQFYDFPEEDVFYVFMGSEEGVERFFQKSESTHYQYFIYEDVISLLKINNGVFPIVVLLDNGKIVGEYGFRNMREEEIRTFFEKTNGIL